MARKKCPRCGMLTMHKKEVMNALSRRDNKTYICTPCGTEEALIDAGFQAADDRETAFVSKIKA